MQDEWAKANPRPYWNDDEYWAACRPDFGTDQTEGDE